MLKSYWDRKAATKIWKEASVLKFSCRLQQQCSSEICLEECCRWHIRLKKKRYWSISAWSLYEWVFSSSMYLPAFSHSPKICAIGSLVTLKLFLMSKYESVLSCDELVNCPRRTWPLPWCSFDPAQDEAGINDEQIFPFSASFRDSPLMSSCNKGVVSLNFTHSEDKYQKKYSEINKKLKYYQLTHTKVYKMCTTCKSGKNLMPF